MTDMLSIGAFAAIGQVSVRTLRHWDAVGLLPPARVDEWTGYRYYSAAQLHTLHRIVALRDLGFGLEQVRTMIADGISAADLGELLRARRAEVERDHTRIIAQLAAVTRRLHQIEQEHHMSTTEMITKPLPAIRLAALRETVTEQPQVAQVIGTLYDRVARAISAAGGSAVVPVAEYTFDDEGLHLIAGFEYAGAEIIELVPAPTAACVVHLGEMSEIASSWQGLHERLSQAGWVPSGPCREQYVRADGTDQSEWVTELQQPVERAQS